MSDKILRALMKLFAIIARVDYISGENVEQQRVDSLAGKKTIKNLLKSELNSENINKYLDFFDQELNAVYDKRYFKKGEEKMISSYAVKVLKICGELNNELTLRQKIIILLRLMEFLEVENRKSDNELDFIDLVAKEFKIKDDEFKRISSLIFNDFDENSFVTDEYNLYFVPKRVTVKEDNLITINSLDFPIRIIQLPSVGLYFYRYFGQEELLQNDREIPSKINIFYEGSWIGTTKISKIYLTGVIKKMNRITSSESIEFRADDITYSFKNNATGINQLCFASNGGAFISIMGGSGTGKSTLLKLFSGELKPTTGIVSVNGLDLCNNKEKLAGLFGVVSQEDLLIEELSVYANLVYAGILTLGHLSVEEVKKRSKKILRQLDLYDIRKLKVGSKEQKIISGGQRKRLNIALELIREPKILLVDEPTSGLSSRDSEVIIDILKESSLRGTLVISVIHQPTSSAFKLFDRLLILDKGGYLIYDGVPLNALVHFKTHSLQGNVSEQECRVCGNVNSEQIFSLIDRKTVNEQGKPTKERRISPKEWHTLYTKHKHNFDTQTIIEEPFSDSFLPKKINQFGIYFTRDFYTKLSNIQYVLSVLFIAPVLSIVLSLCLKYYGNPEGQYDFYSNDNIPIYLFISVIVAIFLGLNTAAEEIIKEKTLIAREKRMKLSRSSYLLSKIALLFAVSAFQIFLFVTIGNSVLEIKGQFWSTWFVLGTVACFFNVLGLLISSMFNSVKVIYIAIPVIIIPQLLFSGVIVPFSRLHPVLKSKVEAPWFGNLHASRWAYEALATQYAVNNKYTQMSYSFNVESSHLNWKRDFWVPEMRQLIKEINKKSTPSKYKTTTINQLIKEDSNFETINCSADWNSILQKGSVNKKEQVEIFRFLDQLKYYYSKRCEQLKNENSDKKKETENQLKHHFSNEKLLLITSNKYNETEFVIEKGKVIRTASPIYHFFNDKNIFNSLMYSPNKMFLGTRISTYWVGVMIIWAMMIIPYLFLYFEWINKIARWVRSRINYT